MPAPYSDNLYSGDYDDVSVSGDDQDALSPTNGYFHASSDAASSAPHAQDELYDQHSQHRRTSSQIPHVPNVMVEDPTLRQQQGADKAREAEEERLLNEAAHSASESRHSHHYQPSSPPHSHSHSRSQSQSQSQTQSHTHTSTHSHPHPHPHPINTNTSTTSTSSSTPYTPYSVTSASGPTSPSHHHRRSVDEDTPILSPTHIAAVPSPYSHAPPAYSPSPSSPPLGPSGGYQTFAPSHSTAHPAMGVPEEQQSLLPREPQSMGGPPEGPKPSLWQRVKDSWSAPVLRKKIKTLLGVLVIISIFLVLFSGLSMKSTHSNPGIIHDEPVRAPKNPNNGNDEMEWYNHPECHGSPHRVAKLVENLSFGSSRSLSVIQTIEKQDNRPGRGPHVSGEVILRPTTDSSGGSIEIQVMSNHEDLPVQIEFDDRHQVLELITPRRFEDAEYTTDPPCIQIRATVWIPQRSYLKAVSIDTVHLDVEIRDGLVLGTSSGFSIKTVVGDVSAPSAKNSESVVPYTIESRGITIRTVSGQIKGWFPLYDLLKLTTVSGDVDGDICPKPAADKSSEPAVLEIDTASGQVKAKEPLDRALDASDPFKKLPPRDYVVRVETVSGDVEADLAMSSLARFTSQSGQIVLRLLPILGPKLEPDIETTTTSGDTHVTVLEPLLTEKASIGGTIPAEPAVPADDDPFVIIHPDDSRMPITPELNLSDESLKSRSTGGGAALANLKSQHVTISGNTVARYPSSWEGELKATTISGNQKVRGKGLEVSTDKGWVEKVIKGHKGNGKSAMKVASMSGDQDVVIGKSS